MARRGIATIAAVIAVLLWLPAIMRLEVTTGAGQADSAREVAAREGAVERSADRDEHAQRIAELEKLGCRVEVDNKRADTPVVKVAFVDAPASDAALARLKGLGDLRELSVRGFGVTDAGLAALEGLTRIETLDLEYTRISDAGLRRLGRTSKLRELSLNGSFRVTDTGLEALERLTGLQSLSLTFVRVTDEGIQELQRALPNLEIRCRYRPIEKTGGESDAMGEASHSSSVVGRWIGSRLLRSKAKAHSRRQDYTGLAITLERLLDLQPKEAWYWRVHAWNCAYNIGAELDDVGERYYWSVQGIKVLLEAVREDPEDVRLPWDVGWFVGQRLGRSDEHRVFRRLFADDADLRDLLIVGLPREEVLGPTGKPDNWLVARQWFLKAEKLAARLGEASLGDMSPVIFYSDAPACLLHYAQAIEEEAVFGDVAAAAWKKAEEAWGAFGDRQLRGYTGQTYRLNDLEKAAQRAKELQEELEALEPGLREALERQRRSEMPEALRRARDKAPDARSSEEIELAIRAERFLRVTSLDVAQGIQGEDRDRALRIGKEAATSESAADLARRYREIVNFDYWKTRSQFEQEESTLEARRLMYEAHRRFREGRLDSADERNPGARQLFERAFRCWRQSFDKYPALEDDQEVGEELAAGAEVYRELLGVAEMPEEFPLRKERRDQ